MLLQAKGFHQHYMKLMEHLEGTNYRFQNSATKGGVHKSYINIILTLSRIAQLLHLMKEIRHLGLKGLCTVIQQKWIMFDYD